MWRLSKVYHPQKTLYTNDQCYPRKSLIVNEMLSFRRNGKKLTAAPGKHDDIIMATAFALTVSPFNKEKNLPFANLSFRVINPDANNRTLCLRGF